MMVTIHGLPIGIKYADIKQLIRDKCTIQEFILDNLVVDDDKRSKKIRVGLADATEGSVVMTQLNSVWYQGNQLTVVPFSKQKQAGPPQQQDNRGQTNNNYQNQGPQRYGNGSQNFNSRDQSRPSRDGYGSSDNDPGNRQDFRSNSQTERSNFGPSPNHFQNTQNQQDFRSDRNSPWSGPNNDFGRLSFEKQQSYGDEHQSRMLLNQTPARPDMGLRGSHQNVQSRQDHSSQQNQGPRREPFQDYGSRGQEPMTHDPWGSNQVQWSSNQAQDPPAPFQQQNMNEFDVGPPAPVRVRDFGNQERFAANVPQPQRQDPWAPNNSAMPDSRSPIMPQRVVEVTDNPIVRHDANNVHARMGKPITIAKDKFQGPTQYSFGAERAPPFRGPNAGPSQPVWETQAPAMPQQHSNFDRNAPFTGGSAMSDVNRFIDKPNDRFRISGPEDGRGDYRRSPIGKRYQSPSRNDRSFSPPRRRRSSSGDSRTHRSPRRLSPRRMSPGRKGFSPVRKALSPVQRVISPSIRVISPSRRAFETNRRGISPPGRRISPPGRRVSPPGRRISPPGRRISPSGRRIPSPPGRRVSPSGRRFSPPGRRESPVERIITATSRRMASPRRLSPQGRKMSPPRSRFSPSRFLPNRTAVAPPKRSFSPPRRSFSPPRRGISPSRRGVSPIHRGMSPVNKGMVSPRRGISPQRRGISSPGRRISMERRKSPGRYSPSSLYDDDDVPARVPPARLHKDVRPAYEPPSAQPKFSSNYRPSVNENVSYPKQGQGDSKVSSWQPRPPMEKKPSDQARFDWEPKRSRSRSPKRRDRSPRDRFRLSPSPRTSRVWGTRVSPDAPPPPSWPGAADFTKSETEKREPVWEKPNFAPLKDDRKMTRAEDSFRRNLPQPERTPHWDMTKQHRPEDSLQDRPDIQNRRVVDNLMLQEDEKRQDYRKQELSKPVSRFDQKERMPHVQRSAKADIFDRHSSDKHNEARNDSYQQQRHKEEPNSRQDESNRKKAIDIISTSLFDKYNIIPQRARDELRLQLSKILLDMIGNKVMSSDDIVIKFYQNYSNKLQEKIVRDVTACLPSHLRPPKRMGEDMSEVASKSVRTEPTVNSFVAPNQMPLYNLVPHPQYGLVQQPIVYPPEMTAPQQVQQITVQSLMPQITQQVLVPQMETGLGSGFVEGNDSTLYLCKEDFDKISPHQAEALRDFIVSEIFEATATTGWAPTFIFKGLKSLHRYEITPENDDSAKWLTNLDFTSFDFFNVLVYTREELWYERAAIWLPGHSKCRNIEPLTKLQLQNRYLDGVNIDKWKLVKKIVSAKGTRIYVDMPPSSSKALRNHKLTLSYELQKVNVFLKSDAVDKDAFDLGVREDSINDQEAIAAAIQNGPMPSVHDELSIVKICFKGSKMVSVDQAKKIKEMVIYNLFKYLQQPSVKLRTDFTKFGFCQPGYFAIQPENSESKKWLLALHIGKLKKHEIVVVGSMSDSTKYLKMQMHGRGNYNSAVILDRLKTANRGRSGLNFSKWKLGEVHLSRFNQNFTLDFEVDIESAQTISKRNSKLDFSDRDSVRFSHKYGDIHNAIKKIKAEEVDNHVVASMDIDSSDDDVIALD